MGRFGFSVQKQIYERCGDYGISDRIGLAYLQPYLPTGDWLVLQHQSDICLHGFGPLVLNGGATPVL